MAVKTLHYTETVTHTLTVEVPDDFNADQYSIVETIDTFHALTGDPEEYIGFTEDDGVRDSDGETPSDRELDIDAQKRIARRLVDRLPEDAWEDDLTEDLRTHGVEGEETNAVYVLDPAMDTSARSALFRRYALNLALWDAAGSDEDDVPASEFLGAITGHTGDDWPVIPGVVVCQDYEAAAAEDFPSLTEVLQSGTDGRQYGTGLVIS